MRKASARLALIVIALCAACSPRQAEPVTTTSATRPAPTAAVSATPAPSPTATATVVAIILPERTGTPFDFPATVRPASVCDGAPASAMILHERGRVTSDDPQPLNVRDQPGLDGRIVGVLHSLDVFYVFGGPACADDYTWFQIRAGSIEGWVAEGEPGLYYIETYIP